MTRSVASARTGVPTARTIAGPSNSVPNRTIVGNLISGNTDFALFPSLTAPTNTQHRWIDGTAGGSAVPTPYQWALQFRSTSGNASFDTTTSFNGICSMHLALTSANSSMSVSRVATTSTLSDLTSHSISVLPSTSYTLSAMMKITVTSGGGRGAWIRAAEFSGAGTGGASNDTTYVDVTTDWALYTKTFTTASTTALVDIQLSLQGTTAPSTLIADVWFANVFLSPTAGLSRSAA